jgi:hypothetical protein
MQERALAEVGTQIDGPGLASAVQFTGGAARRNLVGAVSFKFDHPIGWGDSHWTRCILALLVVEEASIREESESINDESLMRQQCSHAKGFYSVSLEVHTPLATPSGTFHPLEGDVS